ncbi:MAG: 4Fe-4S dicluster domain-containing protein [Candidatus Bathyarchaeia archaeon]|nr:4Fe-4S dicluster domain-containing protein [Candidatus Bathyarchaeota archaeon]
MSEWINVERCNGCGICVNLCPRDVIRLDESAKKAVVKYPEDCINCQFCQAYCPQKAINIKFIPRPPLVSWK